MLKKSMLKSMREFFRAKMHKRKKGEKRKIARIFSKQSKGRKSCKKEFK
jgi:hypothetical protein